MNKTIITEDYCDFETSKLLKEKGFDANCRYVWVEDANGIYKLASQYFMEGENHVSAKDIELVLKYDECDNKDAFLCPTQDMVIKWLRVVHKIGVFPSTYTNIVGRNTIHVYGTAIVNLNTYELMTNECMARDTFNEAVDAAIKYCLENLI